MGGCFRYTSTRLDGSMSIKKRAKVVDKFNDPSVSVFSLKVVQNVAHLKRKHNRTGIQIPTLAAHSTVAGVQDHLTNP